MRKSVLTLSALLLISVFACTKNPFTGKQDFNIVSNDQIFPSAFQQYNEFLKENKVIKGTADAQRVVTVGQKIKAAAEKYLNSKGYQGYLNGYQWEYNLVDSKEVNAWCMPGGKIVVYSGILPITKDEAGLATVMGHEVAHALLNHGAQRMSAAQLQQLGAAGVSVAASGQSEQTQQILMQAYGLGSEVGGMLPFSRKHETEADEVGLTLMAIAGYNPDKAVEFWQRMEANSGGSAPPEFLSTHPSGATRIAHIKSLTSSAKAEAAKFGVKY
ncbi:M48 family metallopeptidase [Flavobacterium sp. NRK1]|uniref:M48 family metallopeptidase n=1 Tax=Flavobacterium sp. NRK1 TaxID=2954929 RepID=UPI0020920B68|nr:M48 family metallopeptidase [Flavobacterium sp. NRK1]MCO6146541.1 M48 family metallopeptidase [Flavobacterium sp. NRK1]